MNVQKTNEIQARKRPEILLLIMSLEAIFAWILSMPWVNAVSNFIGAHPDGDRALWQEPGHAHWLEFLMRDTNIILSLIKSSLLSLAIYFVLSLFPLGALFGALNTQGRFRLQDAGHWAGAMFDKFSWILLVSFISSIAILGIFGIIPTLMIFYRWEDPISIYAWTLSAIPTVCALLIVGWLYSTFDLARALIVRHSCSVTTALAFAFQSRSISLRFFILAWPRWFASIGLLGFTLFITVQTHSVFWIALAHQIAALFRVSLRANVLARALRYSDRIVELKS